MSRRLLTRACRSVPPILGLLFSLNLYAFGARPPAGVEGRVTDRAGVPIGGVRVVVTDQAAASAVTDEEGRFQLDTPSGGVLRLRFAKPGFREVVRELPPSAADYAVEIILLATGEAIVADRIMVVGQPSAVAGVPGSAHYVDKIDQIKVPFDDVHQVLRRVPGINIQEEEGFGLRPNIGMRGTGSERSSKITLMEDGVLIAPAPYASPSAYYFPTLGRMEALEVRKGSSQVRFGPRTNGGVLNLISSTIPTDFSIDGSVAGGAHDTGRLDLTAGGSRGRLGWLAETYQVRSNGFKRLDTGGDTGYRISDYVGKFRISSDPGSVVYQHLEFKVGKTDQGSDETYLGLTDADFEADARRRYRGSQRDRFDSAHEQFQGTWLIAPSERFDFTTTVYRNNFQRNWYKLQSVLGKGLSGLFDHPDAFADELAIVKGADSAPDALRIRANNRSYYSHGIQSVVGLQLGRNHRLETGFRYHEDEEDRFQHEDGFQMLGGRLLQTSQGAPGSQSNRVSDARAVAFFATDRIELGRWTLSPGVRIENVRLTRTDYSTSDPGRESPTRVRTNTLTVAVPGLGIHFAADPTLTLFGGAHRGFSPPGPGSSEDTDPEDSINYEGGARWSRGGAELEAVAFFNDYDNLLGADTLSSGGTGEGDLFNGGRARAWGVETSGRIDAARGRVGAFRIPVRFAYTFTRSTFLEDFESDFEPWGSVRSGDHLPYIAPHQLFAGVTLEAPDWRLGFESIWVGRMRTEAGQGPIPPLRGTDAQVLFNVSGEYDLVAEGRRATLFVTVQNLTDERDIVARRPAGARPGLTRTLMLGVRFELGK